MKIFRFPIAGDNAARCTSERTVATKMPSLPGGRSVEPAVGSALRGSFGVIVSNLLEIGICILEPRPRKHPMQVGVVELTNIAASLARSTRRACFGAEEPLRQPEGQPLLSDSARALQKKARRKRFCSNAFRQALSERLMSVEVNDRHVEIWPLTRHWSGA